MSKAIVCEGLLEVGSSDGGYLPSSVVVYPKEYLVDGVSVEVMVATLFMMEVGDRGCIAYDRYNESWRLGRVRITIERLEGDDE